MSALATNWCNDRPFHHATPRPHDLKWYTNANGVHPVRFLPARIDVGSDLAGLDGRLASDVIIVEASSPGMPSE